MFYVASWTCMMYRWRSRRSSKSDVCITTSILNTHTVTPDLLQAGSNSFEGTTACAPVGDLRLKGGLLLFGPELSLPLALGLLHLHQPSTAAYWLLATWHLAFCTSQTEHL